MGHRKAAGYARLECHEHAALGRTMYIDLIALPAIGSGHHIGLLVKRKAYMADKVAVQQLMHMGLVITAPVGYALYLIARIDFILAHSWMLCSELNQFMTESTFTVKVS